MQIKAPKLSAYLASRTALDTWSRIAAREAYGDNVTFTTMRLGLVTPRLVDAVLHRLGRRTTDSADATGA